MADCPPRNARTDDLADALRHVLADAFAVTALAYLSKWNIRATAPCPVRARVDDAFRAGRRAQDVVARQLLALGFPAALHWTDPADVPRWLLAGQSHDTATELLVLSSGLREFAESLVAAIEVAREVPAPKAAAALGRVEFRQRVLIRALQADAALLIESGAAPGRPH